VVGIPFDRYQTKTLSGDITTNTTISDLTFNNLTAGKTYNIILQANVTTAGSSYKITCNNGGTAVGVVDRGISFTNSIGAGINAFFTAVATTVTFVSTSVDGGEIIHGNDTKDETFATLIELNMTKLTDAFD